MATPKYSTIELCKENMKFSVGHFTIFSETERENLHGHNYNVGLSLTTEVDEAMGLTFDYRYYKKLIYDLCRELNQTTLIPNLSKLLHITEEGAYYHVVFNHEKMIFLKRDAMLVEMTNITVEELSAWFVKRLIEDQARLDKHRIQSVEVKVFSAPGQSGSAHWSRPL